MMGVNRSIRSELPRGEVVRFKSDVSLAMQVIARSGQPAPGATEETLGTFGSVMINNQWAIVFHSMFSSGEGGGVFVFAQNQLQAVALTRMPAPGTDGDVFRSFGRPAINDQGEVAFYGC
jgi:hypothetical protein